MAIFQGLCGPQALSDNTAATSRMAKDAASVVQDAHGQYLEMAYRGQLWSLATAAAGVTCTATQTIAHTASAPILCVVNPSGSGKILALVRGCTQWASGTAAAQGAILGTAASITITTSSGNGALNTKSQVAGGSTASTYTGVLIAGQTAAFTLAEFLGGPTTGALAANSSGYYPFELKQAVLVPPGGAAGIFVAGAGTSPIVAATLYWEEYPFT